MQVGDLGKVKTNCDAGGLHHKIGIIRETGITASGLDTVKGYHQCVRIVIDGRIRLIRNECIEIISSRMNNL